MEKHLVLDVGEVGLKGMEIESCSKVIGCDGGTECMYSSSNGR